MVFIKRSIKLTMQAAPRFPTVAAPFVWNPGDFLSRSEQQEDKNIDLLLGASGATDVLREAFAQKLSRYGLWQISHLALDYQEAIKAAARVYKRGVRCDVETFALEPRVTSAIDFLADHSEVLQYIKEEDFVVVDSNVYREWWPHMPSNVHSVEVSEHSKTLAEAAKIHSALPNSAKRLVVVGGGVLGDTAGFVAGLGHLPTLYVPTTLLAMADSSVGGKTGVNMPPWGKNQIGLFHQPERVLITANWLQTLPEREIKSGLTECLKHALLSGDEELWQMLIELSMNKNWQGLGRVLPRIVQVKADIVSRDPFELGERAVLNLGHTLGHALEALSLRVDGKDALTHGEAVMIGLVYALGLSENHCGFRHFGSLAVDLRRANLIPRVSPSLRASFTDLEQYLQSDKKNDDAGVRWVLLEDWGRVARGSNREWTIPLANRLDFALLDSVIATNA